MKLIINLGIVLIMSGLVFISCEKSEKAPNSMVGDNFDSLYPNAKHIEWEIEKGYYVAEFRDGNHDKEAWFDNSYSWVLTKTEYERKVPDLVKETINNSNYKGWHIDDVDFIEKVNRDPFYIVEVEKGESEVDLYISNNGEIIAEITENGDYHREISDI
ncbi:MAG: PepSY-like domain-containing protein [Bacteroidales bacterium]|jgi:hypothetical protein|nr:PepSY-like domain-containing protein [Bacteroidales bacterium]